MTNLIEANGHNEHTSSGEFYEVVDTTFFYYYNDSAEYVVGDFDEWDDETAVNAAVRAFFDAYGDMGVIEKVTEFFEEEGVNEGIEFIDLIIIDSHRYGFAPIEVAVSIGN